jgi:hypothetical protein
MKKKRQIDYKKQIENFIYDSIRLCDNLENDQGFNKRIEKAKFPESEFARVLAMKTGGNYEKNYLNFLIGTMGERKVAIELRQPYLFFLFKGGDGGHDLECMCFDDENNLVHQRVDVKTTRMRNLNKARLIVTKHAILNELSDIYVLVACNERIPISDLKISDFEILGWQHRNWIIKFAHEVKFEDECFVVNQNQLREFKEIQERELIYLALTNEGE